MFFRGLRCSKTFYKYYWSFVPKIAHQTGLPLNVYGWLKVIMKKDVHIFAQDSYQCQCSQLCVCFVSSVTFVFTMAKLFFEGKKIHKNSLICLSYFSTGSSC
jgi:hypothetical protein